MEHLNAIPVYRVLFGIPCLVIVRKSSQHRYADRINAYWTGYFTSRPALKRYVRDMSGYYVVLFIFLVFVDLNLRLNYLEKLYFTNFRQQDNWNIL